MPVSSKEFLDTQANIECGFTLKCVRDMTRTYSQLERFFENLFKRKLRKMKHAYNELLRDMSLPTLSQDEKKVCDKEINEQVILAMKSFSNNKSPGNNGLTKEFCETSWEELNQSFINSLKI